MKIAVFGTGGVGGYFGGRLAAAGHDVTFIARGPHLEAVRNDGLQVESPEGDFLVYPARATDDPESVGPVEVVLFAVKGWQLPEAARRARPLFHVKGPPAGEGNTVALPLLNGVEAPDQLAEEYGRERVLGGLCRIMAYIEAPGLIRHAGVEPTVVFGELDNRRSERVERIRAVFADAGVRIEIPPDIHAAMWEKFMLIASWSGIGGVTRVPVGVWRDLPGTRSMAEAALWEVVAVAHARDVDLPRESVERVLDFYDRAPADGTASMQRDVMEGRPSELEAQLGAVVRLGAEADVPTPTHAFLYHSLLPQERLARGE